MPYDPIFDPADRALSQELRYGQFAMFVHYINKNNPGPVPSTNELREEAKASHLLRWNGTPDVDRIDSWLERRGLYNVHWADPYRGWYRLLFDSP